MDTTRGFVQKLYVLLCVVLATLPAFAHAHGGARLEEGLLAPGPHGSGVTTVTLFDPTRDTPPNGTFGGSTGRTLVIEVWYPAAVGVTEGRDVPVAALPHGSPLVVHGHGLGSTRLEIRYAATFLATHGYTVASVDFPLSNRAAPGGPTFNDILNQPGDVIFVGQNLPGVAAPFAAELNPDLMALSGFSLGGATALLAGPHPMFDIVSVFAPAYCPIVQAGITFPSLDKPTFVMGGLEDAITLFDLNMVPAFENNAPPRFLVEVADGSHAGFLDGGSALEGFGIPKDAVICSTGLIPVGGPCRGCDLSVIEGDQLLAARQRDLAKVGLRAYLDGYLRCQPSSAAFLRNLFGLIFPEVDVTDTGRPQDTIEHCRALP
jgi:hypothetical protein